MIVVPDDFPVVLGSSAAYQGFRTRHDVKYFDTLPGSEAALLERIGGAPIVINVRSSTRFPASVFAACPAMKQLSIWGTGTDNVDLEAARRHGVCVTNTPGVAAFSIAEHCLAMMLLLARKIPQLDGSVRAGQWQKGQMLQMAGKTLGIIGLGAIGSQFGRLGAAIGMRVIAWTMNPGPDRGFEQVPLEMLLRDSDVVSLHLRLSEKTNKLIGAPQLALMKPSAIFINTARGAIVDEAALVDALAARRIAAAGLDVFEVEPLPPGHALTQLDNVVLTPHCSGVTPETLEAGLAMSLDNVEAFLRGAPEHVVV
ncbi:MAG: NAD(P)-dependent oxidoreductase [Bryobacteraceae bacterium]